MFNKKIIPIAGTVLLGSLLLTGCTPAADTSSSSNSGSSSTEAKETAAKEVAAKEELLKALNTGTEKAVKDGYSEEATDGRASVIIGYDPVTDRTVTSDSSGQSFWVAGFSSTMLSGIQDMLESGEGTVTKEGDTFTIKLAEMEGFTMTLKVQNGLPVEATSENTGNAKWTGKLYYKLTDKAKTAFETAEEMPAPEVGAGQ